MKIAIAVHGRFHAFDLARELIKSGADVYVLTNYPKRVAVRYGIPRRNVRNNLLHGIVSRVIQLIGKPFGRQLFESFMFGWFSRWAARIVRTEKCDLIHGFSGASEELFRETAASNVAQTLVRGSTHIEEQYDLLCAEQIRTGESAYLPSEWMRKRELREYEMADCVIVLSNYAYDSFIARGVASSKLRIMPLGTQLDLFHPTEDVVQQRCDRIKRGEPLRILTVGTFSLRKGAWDHLEVALALKDTCSFRFVGTVLPKAKEIRERAEGIIEFVPRVNQHDLPEVYAWADLFLFLTIEDGYAVVLSQAFAAGLPILATTNCAAPELVRNGETGWVYPIRRPDLFVERLRWCHDNREEFLEFVKNAQRNFSPRDWADVARDFVAICEEVVQVKRSKSSHVT